MRNTQVVAGRRRRKKILRQARGAYGARSKHIKIATENLHRGWAFAYKHRRLKKRDFRRLWITRISAASRARGITYSAFMNGLLKADVAIDRKQLSELAIHEPQAFDALVETARKYTASS